MPYAHGAFGSGRARVVYATNIIPHPAAATITHHDAFMRFLVLIEPKKDPADGPSTNQVAGESWSRGRRQGQSCRADLFSLGNSGTSMTDRQAEHLW